MLTSDLVRPRIRVSGGGVTVEMVDEEDEGLVRTAQELIDLLRGHVGKAQVVWEEALARYIGTRVDYVVVRGLAKVLTDGAEFTPLAVPEAPLKLRERAFAYGPVFREADMFHTTTREEVLQSVAGPLELSAEQMEELLFADRMASYRLSSIGQEWTPALLLNRYNLELARGVLYWASHITVEVADNYKDLWRYIKLFKLMFVAEPRREGGYRIDLDGPISPFVGATLRYGRQLAAFLPALLLCEQWRMRAAVYPPQAQGEKVYQLDYRCALQSSFKRSGMFDSRLEADFAQEFEEKVGSKRGHWRLRRESELLVLGDTVMVPDFVLVDSRDEARRILIELVGFWHPHYLRRKLAKVREANCPHLLLLVYEGLKVTEEAFQDVASEVIFFKQKPVLKEVMARVEEMTVRLYGPVVKKGSGGN